MSRKETLVDPEIITRTSTKLLQGTRTTRLIVHSVIREIKTIIGGPSTRGLFRSLNKSQ